MSVSTWHQLKPYLINLAYSACSFIKREVSFLSSCFLFLSACIFYSSLCDHLAAKLSCWNQKSQPNCKDSISGEDFIRDQWSLLEVSWCIKAAYWSGVVVLYFLTWLHLNAEFTENLHASSEHHKNVADKKVKYSPTRLHSLFYSTVYTLCTQVGFYQFVVERLWHSKGQPDTALETLPCQCHYVAPPTDLTNYRKTSIIWMWT